MSFWAASMLEISKALLSNNSTPSVLTSQRGVQPPYFQNPLSTKWWDLKGLVFNAQYGMEQKTWANKSIQICQFQPWLLRNQSFDRLWLRTILHRKVFHKGGALRHVDFFAVVGQVFLKQNHGSNAPISGLNLREHHGKTPNAAQHQNALWASPAEHRRQPCMLPTWAMWDMLQQNEGLTV